MKPYYGPHAGITIYNADCREVWPQILSAVNALICDPPYGVAFKGKATKHTEASGGYLGCDDSQVGPEMVIQILPFVERAVVFPGIRNLFYYPPPRDVGCVYCPSGAGTGPWGFTCFHPILFYGLRPGGPTSPSSIVSFDLANCDGHPCPKPLQWMKWLVKIASVCGDSILDPFMGSATTLVAAKQLGRHAIGIEIEERYCEIGAKRLEQEMLPFTDPLPEPEQQTMGLEAEA